MNSRAAAPESAPGVRSGFSRRLLVVIRPGEITVNTSDVVSPVRLGLDGLALLSAIDASPGGASPELVLERLTSIALEHETSSETLVRLLDELRKRRLIAPLPIASPAVDDAASTSEPVEGEVDASVLDGWFRLNGPLVLRLRGGLYEFVGHDGTVKLRLTAPEVFALKALSKATTRDLAIQTHRSEAKLHAVPDARFEALLRELAGRRLVSSASPHEGADIQAGIRRRLDGLAQHFVPHALAQDAAERIRADETGKKRVQVVPVGFGYHLQLALGYLIAYARAFENGRLAEHYEFRTDFVWAPDRFDVFTRRPAVYLFSNYLWSHAQNTELSRKLKDASPHSIMIHGGPDTPMYPADVERHFANQPHVDIVVHGEGEQTLAEVLARLAGSLEGGRPVDLSILADVPGISYRLGDGVVRTADRERIRDLDTIPSPYLTGLFDGYLGLDDLRVTFETNRGCPYGCTFCDWGAATRSRIREFGTERVLAELRWIAKADVTQVWLADANFGIFPRDVEIAEEVARLRIETGAPRAFQACYAKNSTKHLRPIVETLTRAGLLAQGVLSFQTNDRDTLAAVRRSNIKKAKYDELATEMRNADLPLIVELMFGLPGSTVASFKADLQECVDRELSARIHPTMLLVNSPMNDPSYREAHGIVTDSAHGPGSMPMLVSTRSYTEQDHRRMTKLRDFFVFADHFGCLRLVSRFVRQEKGLREIELLEDILERASKRREYPLLCVLAATGPALMAPPVSWRLLFAELRHYLVHVLGVPSDSGLDTVLQVQAALLPSADRALPERLDLRHDIVAWHRAMIDAKHAAADGDWTEAVPRLATFGPGTLQVEDPSGEVSRALGAAGLTSIGIIHWEYDTPLARRIVAKQTALSAAEHVRSLL